ncbi:MAG TPA: glycosyltransferase family 4 protein [Longimicrobiales bacterium]|nr:glycosyltransferase family 4 protein [Longimicrobiales bacterium]
MPNVLHLINTAGPGGAETVFENIVRYLPRDRWRSVPVVRNEGWLPDRLREAGHEPVILGSRTRHDVAYYSALRSLIRERGIDLVHAHYFGPAVSAGLLGLLCGIPAVATLHGTGDLSPNESFRALKLAAVRRGVTRLIFVSAPLRDSYLPRLGIDRRRAVVIPNGVEPHFFRPTVSRAVRAEIGAGPEDFVIGSVGNIRHAKGYDLLLRAVAELIPELPHLRLVIAGDDGAGLKRDLDALSSHLRLSGRVHFLGFRPDVRDVLSALDLFVVSSRTEGFSIAAVQAMAAGLPVLATRSGGPEMILQDGMSGVLVGADSPTALADGIRRLYRDPEERRRLALTGRESAASRFTVEEQVRSYALIYEECLSGQGPKPELPFTFEPAAVPR